MMQRDESIRSEIEEISRQIHRRTLLFSHKTGTEEVIGPTWTPFQGGPAETRIIPSLCSARQTVMFFQAPADTDFPLHRHNESKTMVIVAGASEASDPVVTLYTEVGHRKMRTGDAEEIMPMTLHRIRWHTEAVIFLVFSPGLPTDESGNVIWHVAEQADALSNKDDEIGEVVDTNESGCPNTNTNKAVGPGIRDASDSTRSPIEKAAQKLIQPDIVDMQSSE